MHSKAMLRVQRLSTCAEHIRKIDNVIPLLFDLQSPNHRPNHNLLIIAPVGRSGASGSMRNL